MEKEKKRGQEQSYERRAAGLVQTKRGKRRKEERKENKCLDVKTGSGPREKKRQPGKYPQSCGGD